MNQLEERYRSLLRVLPAFYRREWEDDMVAAFLESMDTGDPDADAFAADYGRPSLAEVASVASLAVRLRVGGVGAPPRPYAWGQAVRLVTLMVLLYNAVMATAGIATTLWLSGNVFWLPAPPSGWAAGSPWHIAWGLARDAWLPAYLALVLGHRRAARAVALVAIVPAVVSTAVNQAGAGVPLTVSPWMPRLLDVGLLLGLAAFHRGTPPVPRRAWLLALPVGVVLVPVPIFALMAGNPALIWLDLPGLYCAVVVGALVVYLAGQALGRRSGRLPWSLAFTLLAGIVLVVRLVTMVDVGGQVERGALLAIDTVQAGAVLAVGLPIAVLALRALRRLPDLPDGVPESARPTRP